MWFIRIDVVLKSKTMKVILYEIAEVSIQIYFYKS